MTKNQLLTFATIAWLWLFSLLLLAFFYPDPSTMIMVTVISAFIALGFLIAFEYDNGDR